MKKIGILTYHYVPNFGAQLQTLSTIGYLKKHGYEPIVLHWYPYDLENFYIKEVPEEQRKVQQSFADQNMPLSRLCRTVEDVAKEIERLKIEAVFIGSDALFDYTPVANRKHYDLRHLKVVPLPCGATHNLPNAFWASFNDYLKEPVPVVGYSISSQNAAYRKLNSKEKKELNRLLDNFRFLTLRDQWTCDMVKYISGRNDVYVTPDPVFAFNYNTDFNIEKFSLLKKYGLPENYILISFCHDILDDDYINEVIMRVESKTGFKCVSFPMPRKLKKYNTEYTIELPLSTLDWYFLIKYSQGYIGELMHPIIVSLHNGVPFFCFDQYGTFKTIIPMLYHKKIPESSKIYDILKKADLLTNVHSYQSENTITPDEVVSSFLEFDKRKCITFAEAKLGEYNQAMSQLKEKIR